MINDILDFSKLESNALKLELRMIDVKTLASDIYSQFADQAKSKDLGFRFEISDDYPEFIETDEFRIKQILTNLIGNAFKFTSHGEIIFRFEGEFSMTNAGKQTLHSTITVEDTGIGIAESKLHTLFDTFTQADSSTTRNYGGSGLGLSIVKKLLHLLEGDVKVESELGKGTRFTVTLSHAFKYVTKNVEKSELFEKEESAEKGSDRCQLDITFDASDYKILVAEDNKTNQFIIRSYFKKLGADIEISPDGLEAVKTASKKKFDIIFMDLHMPNLDGISAARRIKDMSLNTETPVVALTADVYSDVTDSVGDDFFADFLSKPLKLQTLKECLAKVLGRKRPVGTKKSSETG